MKAASDNLNLAISQCRKLNLNKVVDMLKRIRNARKGIFEIVEKELQANSIQSLKFKRTPEHIVYGDNNAESVSKEGIEYKPVTPFTIEHRISNRGSEYVLRDTDKMYNTIKVRIIDGKLNVISRKVGKGKDDLARMHSYGFNIKRFHGDGSIRVSPRPMVGIFEKNIERLNSRIYAFIKSKL